MNSFGSICANITEIIPVWNSNPKLPKLQSVVSKFVTVNWSCQAMKQTSVW